ncbi:MAG TPA: ParA family protein [Herpetosiphonaceae bacterium]
MPIIAFANQKGGVGKTTSVLNAGWSLAQQHRRVLLVDLDPQASLTSMLGLDAFEANLAHVLGITERGTTEIAAIIRPIGQRLDLVPGDILLSRTELGLVVRASREHQLARVLAPLRDRYDLILIDAPPSLGMLTINALVAAQWVLVPTLLDALALRGLGLFVETLAEVQAEYTQAAQMLGVLPTLADLRTVHARDVLTALRNRPDLRLFDTIIPRSIRFSEAALAQQPIAQYDPTNTGAAAYAALAEEILARA